MNKIENLAKMLFLFFAVISLGLITVSCSDDDDDCNECKTEVKDSFSMPNSSYPFEYGELRKESDGEFILRIYDLYIEDDPKTKYVKDAFFICNPSKLSKAIKEKASTTYGVKVVFSGIIHEGTNIPNDCIITGDYVVDEPDCDDLEILTIKEYIK